MSQAKFKKSFQKAWAASPRLDAKTIRNEDRFDETDQDADWRYMVVSVDQELKGYLRGDLRTFISRSMENDIYSDEERCKAFEDEMRETGAAHWLDLYPVIAYMVEDSRGLSFCSMPHVVGVAFHVFGITEIPMYVAVYGSSRHTPEEPVKAWKEDPPWSVHALDGEKPLYDDGFVLYGQSCKLVTRTIFGQPLEGEYSADDVSGMYATVQEWDASQRDAWLDGDDEEYPARWTPKQAEALDAAASEVVEFFENAVHIGRGIVVRTSPSG